MSDKKVEELFSFNTVNKVLLALRSSKAKGKTEDFRLFFLVFLISKLHLHAINSAHTTAKHRSMLIIITMLFFINVDRISPMLRRNMILELIANAFLVLNKGIIKIRHATFKLYKHVLDNIC